MVSIGMARSGANRTARDTGCNLPPDPFACQIQQGNERKNKEEHNSKAIPLVIFLINMEQDSHAPGTHIPDD